jgi:hypothetical protein
LALQLTPIVQKPVLEIYELQFDYTLLNEIMMVVKRFGCQVLKNEMQLFIRMVIGIPRRSLDLCLDKLKGIHGVSVKQQA